IQSHVIRRLRAALPARVPWVRPWSFRSVELTALLSFCLLVGTAVAAGPPLEIEVAFKPAQIESMRISPDSKHVAALGYFPDWRQRLLVIDAQTGETKVVQSPSHRWSDPETVSWIANDLLAINTYF